MQPRNALVNLIEPFSENYSLLILDCPPGRGAAQQRQHRLGRAVEALYRRRAVLPQEGVLAGCPVLPRAEQVEQAGGLLV
ncbi:MAG: AAA family ATPase, partial [Sinobacteraceae bacterium]|nr:AAA family ATPase [Nevskiaceae bacterium]